MKRLRRASDASDTPRPLAEKGLERERFLLGERIKEQRTLYEIFRISDDPEASTESILTSSVKLIPSAMVHPDRVSVRLEWGDRCFETPGFEAGPDDQLLEVEDTTEKGEPVRLTLVCGNGLEGPSGDGFLSEEAELARAVVGRLTDVLDRRHAAAVRRDQALLIETMFAQIRDAIVLVDPDSQRFVSFNRAAHQCLGYSREEFAQLSVADVQAEYSRATIAFNTVAILAGEVQDLETRHRRKDGGLCDVLVNFKPFEHEGRQLIASVWRDITEDKRRARAQRERAATVQLQSQLIHQLSVAEDNINGQFEAFARHVTERLGEALRIPRVSVWLYDAAGTQLECIDLFELDGPKHSSGVVLSADTYATEIGVLRASRYVDASDAINDPRTAGFLETYTKPLGISSMLDCSILSAGRQVGVMCLEYVGEPHTWDAQEISFGCQVADQLGMTILNRERLALVQALRRSESFLSRAQAVSQTGHWYLDIPNDRLFWSAETHRIFGVRTNKPLTLEDFAGAVHPQDRDAVLAAWNAAITGRAPYRIVHRILANGEIRWVEERAEIEFDDAGQAVAGLGIVQDISERVATTQELEQHRLHLQKLVASRTAELEAAKASAEAANRAKSVFLSNMSHEIRTPMNAVIGFAHLLRLDPLTPRQQDQLDKLIGSSRHLLQIINDILDLSKIEAEKMTLEIYDFEPRRLLEHVCDLVSEEVAAKGLALDLRFHEIPKMLRGDGVRFSQILLNLVSNAVKFTERGGISIAMKTTATHQDAVILRCDVRDTGIGITQAQSVRLFRAFEQADGSTTRRFGGTGLGLAITKLLTEAMGGRIGVESRPGEGSLFWVEIPFEPLLTTRTSEPGEAARSTVRGRRSLFGAQGAANGARQGPQARILLVEDSAINQEVTSQLLESAGMNVSLAANGLEAVERCQREPFDLVLMDVQMPVMDGIEATRAIRRLRGCERLPILAMTADAFSEARQRCLDAGMNDHVSKPVEPAQLIQSVSEWLPAHMGEPLTSSQFAEPGRCAHHSSPGPEWMRIDGLDPARGLRSVQGDGPAYRRLLERFVTDHGTDAQRLLERLEQGDREGLRQGAHRLKGVAATVGAERIRELASELERRACRDPTLDQVEPLLQSLGKLLERLAIAISERLQQEVGNQEGPAAADVLEALADGRTRALMSGLRQRLAEGDLKAVELYAEVRPYLNVALDEERLRRLDGFVRAFAFDLALETLDEVDAYRDADQQADHDPGGTIHDQP